MGKAASLESILEIFAEIIKQYGFKGGKNGFPSLENNYVKLYFDTDYETIYLEPQIGNFSFHYNHFLKYLYPVEPVNDEAAILLHNLEMEQQPVSVSWGTVEDSFKVQLKKLAILLTKRTPFLLDGSDLPLLIEYQRKIKLQSLFRRYLRSNNIDLPFIDESTFDWIDTARNCLLENGVSLPDELMEPL